MADVKVLVSDPIAEEGIAILRQHVAVDVRTGLRADELAGIIGEYDGLVVRSETKVTAPILEAATRLQVVGRAGVGVDNIDVEAATRRGVVVLNAPAGNTVTTAEHTIAMMFALARNLPQAYSSLKAGQWQRSKFVGTELRNKVLGIVGLGRVGTEVARRVQGLEMRVLAYDPYVSLEHARSVGAEVSDLERVLREADFLTVHTPLTDETKALVGTRELAMMKPTARVVNCARGGIIDEDALCAAVAEGRIAGAALDVFRQEPLPGDSALLKSDRIVVTPHLGASTEEAQVQVAIDVADQVLAVLRGQSARYAVNMPLVPAEAMGVLAPYVQVCISLGELLSQLMETQIQGLTLTYAGDIAEYDTSVLTANVLKGLLKRVIEEPVNLVNAYTIARSRGLRITEERGSLAEAYHNLVTVVAHGTDRELAVAGTTARGESHVVMIDGYWVDLVPNDGYWLVSNNVDRPGMIGRIGTILGQADVNISMMQVGRAQPRGKVLMVLGLDEPIPGPALDDIRSIPDIYTARVVKL